MTYNYQSLLSWSGGKDAALALYEAKLNSNINITTLITTIELPSGLTPVHRIHSSLIELQAMRIGVPLKQVFVSDHATLEEYESNFLNAVEPFKRIDIAHIAFGDIFLEEMKTYREKLLDQIDMRCLFPLWLRDTSSLCDRFLKAGFKAKVICVNAKYLSGDYVGREYNEDFVSDLPQDVDMCGENGEFHTFVYDGPVFKRPIECDTGERDFVQVPASEKSNFDTAFWNVPVHANFR